MTKRGFDVMIGIPVPMIDQKVNKNLMGFVTAAAARQLAIPNLPDSRIPEFSRNVMIDQFLNDENYKDMSYLMFIDADTCPIDPYAIERMIEMDKDVVSGITPIMTGTDDCRQVFWNVKNSPEGNMMLNEMPQEPFRADKVGGSCLLIKRHVLEKLVKPYQMSIYDDNQIQFKLSEDYYFCNKINEAGFDIWVNPTVICHHYHMMDMFEWIEILTSILNQNKELTEQVHMISGGK